MASIGEKLDALQEITGSWARVARMLGTTPQSVLLIRFGASVSVSTMQTIDEAYEMALGIKGDPEQRTREFMRHYFFLVREQRAARNGPGWDAEFS